MSRSGGREATHAATLVFSDGALRPGLALEVGDTGEVLSVRPRREVDGQVLDHGHAAILPGPVNVHSHSFQTLARGPADRASGFADWVDRYLYPLALGLGERDVYDGALLAFGEMALNGFTAVGEFFYIQNDPGPSFGWGANRYAHAAIRAAREIGLRIHLLRAMYDADRKDGQRRFAEAVDRAVEGCENLRQEFRDDPFVTVGPAPHSLHGASADMIKAGAALSRDWGSRLHIHLAEQRQDVPFARERYGTTPLRALESLGVLDDRLVVVHACWLDQEEIQELGGAGGGLAYNPCSNAALGDGVTDLPAMLRAGVAVGLGTDGACANNQQDPWREMRTAEYLQRVRRLEMGVLAREAGGAATLLEAGTAGSARNLDLRAGSLEPGRWADFVVLDLDDLSLQPTFGDDPDAVLQNIVYSMSARAAVRHVYVAGEAIVQNGALIRVDPDRLGRIGRGRRLPYEAAADDRP